MHAVHRLSGRGGGPGPSHISIILLALVVCKQDEEHVYFLDKAHLRLRTYEQFAFWTSWAENEPNHRREAQMICRKTFMKQDNRKDNSTYPMWCSGNISGFHPLAPGSTPGMGTNFFFLHFAWPSGLGHCHSATASHFLSALAYWALREQRLLLCVLVESESCMETTEQQLAALEAYNQKRKARSLKFLIKSCAWPPDSPSTHTLPIYATCSLPCRLRALLY